MQITNTITNNKQKPTTFNIFQTINQEIEAQQSNAMGIAIILIIAGTMIASISAALAVHKTIAYFPLVFTCISAMGANAMAISQRSFKTIAWSFIISITGNIFLIIYQLMTLAA